jgi:hypothetical protein
MPTPMLLAPLAKTTARRRDVVVRGAGAIPKLLSGKPRHANAMPLVSGPGPTIRDHHARWLWGSVKCELFRCHRCCARD